MTEVVYSPKIKPEHLARKAIVYLRQSSDKQVRQNKESQLLQYAVADRVRALGWAQVEVINSDLGSSAGIAAAQREGFERVLSLVALGEVGIVGSREVSRLSRTDKDWCRLLEVCQIFGTLIADEQQVYDLNYLDDQLVLGIKGTLSVVELKVIRQRLLAGQESKARRGELFKRLPIGYARDAVGKVVLHPQKSIAPSRKLWTALHALDGYLTGQSDWLVNYAERHRAGLRVGTAITEGTANFLVNRRMNKSQQMRWSRRGADLLLQVRCAVYNGTLDPGFGQRFQPANDPYPTMAMAAA
jgi:DNA invertase Pin-like site-specific DNA recombinase